MKEEIEGKTAVIELQVIEYRKKFYITHQLNTFSALQCHYWNCELRFEAVLSLKHKETLCCFHSIFHLLCIQVKMFKTSAAAVDQHMSRNTICFSSFICVQPP